MLKGIKKKEKHYNGICRPFHKMNAQYTFFSNLYKNV